MFDVFFVLLGQKQLCTRGDKSHPYALGKGSPVGAGLIPARFALTAGEDRHTHHGPEHEDGKSGDDHEYNTGRYTVEKEFSG